MNIIGTAVMFAGFAGAVYGQLAGIGLVRLNKWDLKRQGYCYFGLICGLIYCCIGAAYGSIVGIVGWLALLLKVPRSLVTFAVCFIPSFLVIFLIGKWRTQRSQLLHVSGSMLLAALVSFSLGRMAAVSPSFLTVLLTAALFLPTIIPCVWYVPQSKQDTEKKVTEQKKTFAAPPSFATESKVLLIGVDAADWAMIDALRAKGALPNLAKLMDNGFCAHLATMKPTSSGMIWTSIATGKTPPEHGVLHWQKTVFPGLPPISGEALNIACPRGSGLFGIIKFLFKKNIIKVVPYTSASRKCKALWNMMTDCGKTSATVGWLFSWPAEKVKGLSVSWYVYPFEEVSNEIQKYTSSTLGQRTYPEDYISEIEQCIVRQNQLPAALLKRLNIPTQHQRYGKRRFADKISPWYVAKDTTFANITRYILKNNKNCELVSIFLAGIDVSSHAYWAFMNEQPRYEKWRRQILSISDDEVFKEESKGFNRCVELYYQYIDELLGQFLSEINNDWTIIVASDHGFAYDAHQHSEAPAGVFIASGKNIKPTQTRQAVSLYDIAPTILSLLGMPVAHDMKGNVITGCLTDSFLRSYPVRYIDSYEDFSPHSTHDTVQTPKDVEEGLKRQLRALGYIE